MCPRCVSVGRGFYSYQLHQGTTGFKNVNGTGEAFLKKAQQQWGAGAEADAASDDEVDASEW